MVGKWRNHSNLRSFLSRTTPAVPVYTLPKDLYWQPILQSKVEYFNLVDLWDQYSEWSAYGLGVPIILDNCDSVVQYYVPFLSAIQIYSSKSHALMRSTLEDNERESFSDDSESEKLSRSSDAVSDDSLSDQEVSLSTRHLLGQLYLHYIEYGSPYGRIPLVDKVNELAQMYPGLRTLRNVDISPASWMSVAWYPIYHIPSSRNVKDLSACFLTYHIMSASFRGMCLIYLQTMTSSCSLCQSCLFPKMHSYKLSSHARFHREYCTRGNGRGILFYKCKQCDAEKGGGQQHITLAVRSCHIQVTAWPVVEPWNRR
ncbi:uncharacterized protein LOC122034930 isoform X3 [Zingiber officinale]|uniref:uncharacterized protein LOC122034930 isoform X3 n=1 Tax=Zingiber officinale TaxID=94328 RepID=UPI001C4D2CCB|nr:uncharacterized protein LOC122034930 isoform X3 [Zingiber officinale]